MTCSHVALLAVSGLLGCVADPGASLGIPASDVQATSNMTVPQVYRLAWTQNFGATYLCTSQIQFFDRMLEPISVMFKNQSSCYGCATKCEDCTANYGNARAQFSGVTSIPVGMTAADDSLWSCTAAGSFGGGFGDEYVSFELPKRPARMSLKRVAVGDWNSKEYQLEELNRTTGVWQMAVLVRDAENAPLQTVDIPDENVPEPDPFPYGFRQCGNSDAEAPDISPDNNSIAALSVSYFPASRRVLTNNGHGLQVDGDFGTITIDGFIYDSTQINLRFPSLHTINRAGHPLDGEKAVGEMHILHQSREVLGQPKRLAIVTILLTLPKEGSDTTAEEMFFNTIGLNQPVPNGSADISSAVDLSVFSKQFSNAATMPCTDTMRWFVAVDYAHVSAAVVREMQKGFQDVPFDFGDIPDSLGISGTPEAGEDLSYLNWNGEITGWVPQLVVLSPQQLAVAYATSDWKNVFEEPTPAPTAAPTFEPVFMTLEVDRIDYNQMTASDDLVTNFQNVIRRDVAQWANLTGEAISYVNLKLVKASTFLTKVVVTIMPKAGPISAPDGPLPKLGEKIHEDLLSITTLRPITSGNMTVDGPTVSRWVDPSTIEGDGPTAPPGTVL